MKKNKNQHNDAIEHELKFDHTFSLYEGNKELLQVVAISLRGGKKQREMMIYGLTCLWDSGATDNMIKRKHNKYYECRIQSNKL